VLERAAGRGLGRVLDAGSGLGTFGTLATPSASWVMDVDRSVSMLREGRRRAHHRPAVRADVGALPVRDGAVDLAHAERILQWCRDPDGSVHELVRVTAPGGLVAVTDTDWGTFAVDHPDARVAEQVAAAARRWVPHPRLAASLPRVLRGAGLEDLEVRADVALVSSWDPSRAGEEDGPPGLPLRTIVAAGGGDAAAVDALADAAASGAFLASVVLLSVVGRR
jgi:SAM-dependent methyltransferase